MFFYRKFKTTNSREQATIAALTEDFWTNFQWELHNILNLIITQIGLIIRTFKLKHKWTTKKCVEINSY